MDIKELSETALLDHAMTSKKRSKAIEEFLKLTFKSQVDSNCCHEDLVNLGLFSFGFLLKFHFIGGWFSTNQKFYYVNETRKAKYGDFELTRTELAEIFGQSNNSNLSNRVFEVIDRDKNGHICAREFADILILLLKGSIEEKAALMHRVYNLENHKDLTLRNGFERRFQDRPHSRTLRFEFAYFTIHFQ